MGREPKYITIYEYYKKLILSGTLKSGTKLPSIRQCAAERRVSRTTIEAAFSQLVAEGYAIAQPGSGYYVTALEYMEIGKPQRLRPIDYNEKQKIIYDFSSAKVDAEGFNFDVWRRYIKSALRQTERLLSYGDPQGEYDLRVAICDYIREKRGVVCTPNQIVVGAGMQPLLHILCSLISTRTFALKGAGFKQGKVIFEDRGFIVDENMPKVIYTSPSHHTPWGDIMSIKERLELLSYAKEQDCLIIEDDYDSEFNYYNRPTPSLQGLDGGEHVVYMSTFSNLLLPSLRMSFMVLPSRLMDRYEKRASYYNQTSSKAEQIALCQFIRDGHFEKHVRKARKLYLHKKQILCNAIDKVFEQKAKVLIGTNGFLVQLEIKTDKTLDEVISAALEKGVKIKGVEEVDSYPRVLLSCSGIPEEAFEKVLRILKELI